MSTSLSRIVLQWKAKPNVLSIRLLLIWYVQGLLSPIFSITLNSQKKIWEINVKKLKSFRQDYHKINVFVALKSKLLKTNPIFAQGPVIM